MIFMMLFWIVIGVILFLLLLRKIKIYEDKRNVISFLVFLQFVFFLLAIATDDPFFPSSWGIDPWWELTIEGVIGAFAIWQAYLNPLKMKVYSMDREIGELKTEVQFIKTDVIATKERLDKLDLKFETKFEAVQTDIRLIKEKLFST